MSDVPPTPGKMKPMDNFDYDGFIFEKASVNAQLLAQMPRKRQVKFPQQGVNYTRSQNVEAYIGHEVGDVQAVPCKHCASGYGHFKREGDTRCVTVNGYFHGSCTSCHHGSSATRCSFGRNPPQSAMSQPSTSTPASRKRNRDSNGDSPTPAPKRPDFGKRKPAEVEAEAAKNVFYDHTYALAQGMDADALASAYMAVKMQKKAFKDVMRQNKEQEK